MNIKKSIADIETLQTPSHDPSFGGIGVKVRIWEGIGKHLGTIGNFTYIWFYNFYSY